MTKERIMSVRFSEWEKRIIEKWAKRLGRDQSAAVREAALHEALAHQLATATPVAIHMGGVRYIPAGTVEDEPLPSTTWPALSTKAVGAITTMLFWVSGPMSEESGGNAP